MIRWTQGGTTKSINNNNIVYAKNGADGEPVLVDRIIAVDTSTNPPTESVVYQSNSILRALPAPSEVNLPSMTGGQAWLYYVAGTPKKWQGDYLWIRYPTTYNTTNSGTSLARFDLWGIMPGTDDQGNTFPSSSMHYYRRVRLSAVQNYQPTIPVDITYTYAMPYRVVVKVRAAQNALGLRATRENGSTIIGQGGNGNANTTEQILYDGLMDNVTKNYHLEATLKLKAFDVNDNGQSYAGYTVSNFNFVRSPDFRNNWGQDRERGNLIAFPSAITRTIEIYDPNTGDLIASNTSALSTTWTARASS